MEMTSFFGTVLIFLSLKQFVEAGLFRNFVVRIDDLVERLEEATETNKALNKSAEQKMANLTTTVEQLKQENVALNTTLSMVQNMLNGKFWCVHVSLRLPPVLLFVLALRSTLCKNYLRLKFFRLRFSFWAHMLLSWV